MPRDRRIRRLKSHQIDRQSNPLRMMVPVVRILRIAQPIRAKHIHAPFQFFQLTRRQRSGGIIRHQN